MYQNDFNEVRTSERILWKIVEFAKYIAEDGIGLKCPWKEAKIFAIVSMKNKYTEKSEKWSVRTDPFISDVSSQKSPSRLRNQSRSSES